MTSAGAAPSARQRLRFDPRHLESCVESQADFVARLLRNLGVDQGHLDLAVEKVFLLVMRQEGTSEALNDPACLFRAAARIAEQARRRWPRRDPVGTASSREKLDAVLDRLPEDLREVFVLGEIEGRDVEWVSVTLGQTPAWTGARLRRAQRAFSRELDSTLAAETRQSGDPLVDPGEAQEVVRAGLLPCASERARERTLRALEAVGSATVRGRARLLGSRLSLAIWLLALIGVAAAVYAIAYALR